MMTFISWLMFFSGLIVFSLNRKHLLVMLLSLEFVVLSLYFYMLVLLSCFNFEPFLLMVYLTVCVCEGVLGLSILVTMIRTLGNDYVLTFSALW